MLKFYFDIINKCADSTNGIATGFSPWQIRFAESDCCRFGCKMAVGNGFRPSAVHFGQAETDSGHLPCISVKPKKILPICLAFWPSGKNFWQSATHFDHAEIKSAQIVKSTSNPQVRPISPTCRTRDINGGKPCIMNNIKILTMKRLYYGVWVAEIADLASNVCSLYHEGYGSETDAYLLSVMTDLEDLSKRIQGALKHNKTIASLEKYDAAREASIVAIANLAKAFNRLADSTIQSAWICVKPILDDFLPSISEGNYSSRTSLIDAMLARLEEPSVTSSVAALPGLAQILAELQAAQTAFVDKRLEYQKLALQDKTEMATDLKAEIMELINERLIVHLEAMNKVQPAAYGDFATLVDALVTKCNDKVRRRRKRKTKESSSVNP